MLDTLTHYFLIVTYIMLRLVTAHLSYILSGTTVNRFWYRCSTTLERDILRAQTPFPEGFDTFRANCERRSARLSRHAAFVPK
jgi:hypothetical protein